MKNICNLLEINETTDENVVVEKIENMKNDFDSANTEKDGKIETLTNEVETLKNETTDKDNTITELKTQIANQLVDQAIADGKIEENAKETWVNMAVENIENTVTLIDSFKTQSVKITDQIDTNGGNVEVDENKELANKFDEMRKTDSKGLHNLMNSDFETYSKMYFAKYGKQPVKK